MSMTVDFEDKHTIFEYAMKQEQLTDPGMQTWALKFIVGYLQKHRGRNDDIKSQRRVQMLKQLAGTIARLPIQAP